MSERLRLRAFKGPDEEEFRKVFVEEVERCGGEVHWRAAKKGPQEDLRTTHCGVVHTVYIPYLSGADTLLCRLVGAALDVPWIETRIAEGSLWEYSLYRGVAHVDQFSTMPEYWDETDTQTVEQNIGNPDLLAEVWQIPRERVERYLLHWGMEPVDDATFRAKLKGRAYADDQHDYGSIWQMFDFLAALGAMDPMAHGLSHQIIIPPIANLKRAAELFEDEDH